MGVHLKWGGCSRNLSPQEVPGYGGRQKEGWNVDRALEGRVSLDRVQGLSLQLASGSAHGKLLVRFGDEKRFPLNGQDQVSGFPFSQQCSQRFS